MSNGTFVRLILMIFSLISATLASTVHAADVPQSFTLDGKLFSDPAATTALQDNAVTFTVQILDDSKTCVIYEETQSISTLASKGYFSVQVGSEVGSLVRTAGDSANSMAQVFQNISLINGKLLSNGAACTVPPVAAKRRYVRIKILPSSLGGLARTLSPDLTIDSVPNAVIAERAETLQGLRAANVLQVNTGGTNQLSQTNLESLFTSTARFNSLTAVVDGTSTNYMRSNSASGAQLPVMAGAPTGPNPGSVWFDSSDSKLKYQTSGGPVAVGSGSGTVSSVDFTAPSELSVTGAPITTSGTIAVAWATQTANKVFASPDGVTGTPSFRAMVANDIPNLPWSKITSGTPTTLLGYGITDAVRNVGGTPSLESGLDAAKGAATTAGRVWISTDTKQIYRDNGATWDLIGSGAPGGVTSVSSANSYLSVANGSTTPSLTLNVGTAANTVAAGNDSRITGALQQATAFSGDVSGAYNATSVDKIKGTSVSITALGTGNFLKYNGTDWVNASLGASDVTTALTYTPVNKAGDTMSGLLVLSADPSASLGASTKQYVDSATSTAQSNAQTYADTKFITKNLPAAPSAGQNGQSIRWNNGSNTWEYYTAGTGGGDFMASGSVPMTGTLKMGGNAIYGNTTASGNLTLESTSDATKGHVVLQPNGGNVGIGTTAPGSSLDLGSGQLRVPAGSAATPSIANRSDANTGFFFGTDAIYGSIDGARRFEIANTYMNTPATVRFDTDNSVGYRVLGNDEFSIFTADTDRLFVGATGNVGIGTTSPSSKFHVQSNSTGSEGLYIRNTNAGASAESKITLGSDNTHVGNIYLQSDAGGGRFVLESYNGPGTGISLIADGVGDDIRFATGGTTERLRIDGSGNVGIGTTSPATILDINGGQTFRGVAAASAPPVAGQGKVYYDSTANKFKVSENNGAYVDLVGGGGTVTSVSSTNSYLSVANGSSTPALTLNVGTAANTVAAGDDSRITGALQQATAFSGDVSGIYSATSVDKIKGTSVSITALGTGNFLKYDGTNWINSSLAAGDITGALTYTPVNKAGDTMSGLLVLSADPSASLGAATKQYVDSATSTAQSNAQTYADTKFITKNLPAAPAAGQNGQSIRWNNGSNTWEYYTAGSGGGDFMASGSVPMTGTLKMGGNAIYGNTTASGNLTLESTSDVTKGFLNLQPNGGNVGIGTTGPTQALDVRGNAIFRNTSNSTSSFEIQRSDGNSVLSTDTTNRVVYITGTASSGYSNSSGTTDAFNASNYAAATTGTGAGYNFFVTDTTIGQVATSLSGNNNDNSYMTFSTRASDVVAEKMRITSAGNVGIGTATPGSPLDVKGATSAIRSLNNSDSVVVDIGSSSDAGLISVYNSSGTRRSGLGSHNSAHPLIFSNASSDKSSTSETAYGAGLFITAPFAVGQENGIFFGNSATWSSATGGAITFYTTDISGSSRGGLKFKTRSATSLNTQMTIDPTGNVGIGTTSPATILDINGGMTYRGVAAAAAPPTAGQGKIYYDSTANKFKVSENNGAYVDLVGGGGTVTSVSSTNSYLTVANGSSTPALTLNVGTATNTVAAGDDSRITGALQQATAFSGDVSGIYSATSVDKIKGTSVSITSLGTGNFLKYDGTNWINSSLAAGDITGALTYTPVNKAGDTMTGLLTLSADPSASLGAATKQYVDSAIATGVAGAGDFKKDGSVAMTGTLKMGGSAIYGNSTASGNLTLESTSDSTKGHVVLQPNGGNVGIGTTSPTAQLHMENSTWFNFLMKTTAGTAGPSIKIDHNSADGGRSWGIASTGSGNTAGAGKFVIWDVTSSQNRLTIDSSGNVGIGTTSPDTKLSVSGGIVGTSYGLSANDRITTTLKSTPAAGGTNYIILNNEYGGGNFSSGIGFTAAGFPKWLLRNDINGNGLQNFSLYDYVAGLDRLFVDASGNVGIGTTTPSVRLDVSGDIRSSGRITGAVATDADALSALTVTFTGSNTVRATGASAACGTLDVTNTTAGGNFTLTILNATTSCSTILWNGSATNVKLPAGYSGGASVAGIVYTFLDDGATLWVSAVPF